MMLIKDKSSLVLFKSGRRYIAACLTAAVLFGNVSGQAKRSDSKRAPKYEESSIASISSAAKSSRMNMAFDQAAIRNSVLQSELSWVFGGKSQRGWYLYLPLILSIIAADVSSSSFVLELLTVVNPVTFKL